MLTDATLPATPPPPPPPLPLVDTVAVRLTPLYAAKPCSRMYQVPAAGLATWHCSAVAGLVDLHV